MSSVVISGDTSGTITLAAPAVAGSTTITLPAATGTAMVSGNMPAIYVTNTSTQSISSATWTKVTLDTEVFDTNNNFASSRFTPTVAGYYQINVGAYIYTTGATMTAGTVGIYKNGTQGSVGGFFVAPAFTESAPVVATIIFLNGSTDYVELYARITGVNPVIGGGAQTFMSGCLLRAS
jgi:hypothetical protein